MGSSPDREEDGEFVANFQPDTQKHETEALPHTELLHSSPLDNEIMLSGLMR